MGLGPASPIRDAHPDSSPRMMQLLSLNSLPDAFRMRSESVERVRCFRAGSAILRRSGFGHQVLRYYGRGAPGAVAGLGQERAGNARLISTSEGKHGWKLSLGTGVPARAAVEAPEGGGAPERARCRADHQKVATFVDGARQMVGMRLSALRLPLLYAEAQFFLRVVVGTARTHRRRENESSRRHCRAWPGNLCEATFAAHRHGPPGQARW